LLWVFLLVTFIQPLFYFCIGRSCPSLRSSGFEEDFFRWFSLWAGFRFTSFCPGFFVFRDPSDNASFAQRVSAVDLLPPPQLSCRVKTNSALVGPGTFLGRREVFFPDQTPVASTSAPPMPLQLPRFLLRGLTLVFFNADRR